TTQPPSSRGARTKYLILDIGTSVHRQRQPLGQRAQEKDERKRGERRERHRPEYIVVGHDEGLLLDGSGERLDRCLRASERVGHPGEIVLQPRVVRPERLLHPPAMEPHALVLEGSERSQGE